MAGVDPRELADRGAAEISAAADEAALEAARVKYLGRKGALSEATKGIAKLPPSEKPAYGAALNDAKGRIEAALDERGRALRAKSLERDLGGERELLRERVGRVGQAALIRRDPLLQVVSAVQCGARRALNEVEVGRLSRFGAIVEPVRGRLGRGVLPDVVLECAERADRGDVRHRRPGG